MALQRKHFGKRSSRQNAGVRYEEDDFRRLPEDVDEVIEGSRGSFVVQFDAGIESSLDSQDEEREA